MRKFILPSAVSKPTSFGWLVGLLSGAFLVAHSAFAASVPAKASAALLGDWEVTRVLMTHGMQPQWSMREDDPRLMGRVLHIEPHALRFRGADSGCVVGPLIGRKTQPMSTLFAKSASSTGSKQTPAIQGALYGRMDQYELGSLRARAVAVHEIQCASAERKLLADANWIANTTDASGVASAILLAYQPDALLLLRRPAAVGGAKDAKRDAFCATAEVTKSASDRAICADRQLWIMHGYTLSAVKRARSPRAEINKDIDRDIKTQLQKREACLGDPACLYNVLDRHIELLVQRW